MPDIRPGIHYNNRPAVTIPRTKRTRAKRSCDLCRKKKIRCDADVKKPCTSCASSHLECEFLVEQKKRGPATGFSSKKNSYVEVLEARLKRMEALLATFMIPNEKGKHRDSPSEDSEESNVNLCCCPSLDPAKELTVKMDNLGIADYERTRYIGMSSGVHLLHQGLFNSNKPHCIKETPSWFVQKVNDDEEEHILIKSEALKAPPQGFMDRTAVFTTTIPYINQERVDILVQTYFSTYQLLCPIINKMFFLEQYYYQDPSPCDEYLLCALCTIGVRTLTLLDRSALPPCILELTEDEFMEMGKAFKKRALSIFDLIYKRSRISTVQTIILMTLFVESHDTDFDDTSYWFKTGMAIRMAQDLGLHRSARGWHIPEPERELRSRIWYVIYMMDRWVAAELGRPVTIIDQDFDVELPSFYEVESCHPKDLSERPFVPEIIMQTARDIRKKTPLYDHFNHAVRLGQIYGQVLSGLHSPRSIRFGRRSQALVHLLDQRLKNWKLSIPSSITYDISNPKPMGFLSYNCILLLLYRPFISNQESEDMDFAFKALSICTVAANNILFVTENMDIFTIACIPWTISVYSIFQAGIIFLHNAKGNNVSVAEQGVKNLLRCSRVIRRDPCLASTHVAQVLQSIAAPSATASQSTKSTPSPPPPTLPASTELYIPRSNPSNQLNDEPQQPHQSSLSPMIAPSTQQEQHNQMQDMDLDLLFWNPELVPADSDVFVADALVQQHQLQQQQQQQEQQRQQQHYQYQQDFLPLESQPHAQDPLPQYIPQQMINRECLSSEVPLYNMPNSVVWEDWDTFLKSNVS
ncbi:fungal-specific transcription factor domain-containing protein [Halteromyces radiatus]|uniref:fungal-specific transcription factor domain-containing protein n=1 Tax=Halteromyces radiatus TaxID=101107 RepID=UPI00221F4C4B|nr:fungal-specific transcription factor domain-containing protein [Halteromyces radiatus]KAI8089619.1 fungal-specific transcription factor domain-containing protein [Halteromyces radiatus]